MSNFLDISTLYGVKPDGMIAQTRFSDALYSASTVGAALEIEPDVEIGSLTMLDKLCDAENLSRIFGNTPDMFVGETACSDMTYDPDAVVDELLRACTFAKLPSGRKFALVKGELGREDGITSATDVSVGGYVTSLGYIAFASFPDLSSVRIPDCVSSLGTNCFRASPSLVDVNFPRAAKTVSDGCFFDCTSLSVVPMHDEVSAIGTQAFYNAGIVSINLPDSVVRTGTGVFSHCGNLKVVESLGSLSALETWAFNECTSLTDVTLPSTLVRISGKPYPAFAGCSALTSITFQDGSSIDTIEENAFKDLTSLIEFRVPEGVTSIGQRAFTGCSKLSSVTLPSTLKNIGNYAFENCSALQACDIPDGVSSIGTNAIKGCALLSVRVPGSVKSIGNYAFSSNGNLTYAKLDEGVSATGNNMFRQCINLARVDLPDSLEKIDSFTFMECSGLSDIVIPANVNTLNGKIFPSCTSLTGVTFMGPPPAVGDVFNSTPAELSVIIPANVEGWPAEGELWPASGSNRRPVHHLPYDAEVDWLSSDGGQWIDTGFAFADAAMSDDSWIEQKTAVSALSQAQAEGYNVAGQYLFMGRTNKGKTYFGCGGYSTTDDSWTDMQDKTLKLTLAGNAYIDGQPAGVTYSGVSTTGNLYLFRVNSTSATTYAMTQKKYWFKICLDGVLQRDLVPVRITNELGETEGAMYDKVTKALFRNQGTGAFGIGPDKA